jgi:hypothetical protein
MSLRAISAELAAKGFVNEYRSKDDCSRSFGSGNERSFAVDAHRCPLDRFLACRHNWRCCAAGFDIGMLSDIDPPWFITIGSSFIGFFAGAYAAVKLGNLSLRQK